MIPKIVAIITFCVGAWFGYTYALDVLETTGMDPSDYWSEQGAEFLRVALTLFCGGMCGVLGYFAANLFRRFE